MKLFRSTGLYEKKIQYFFENYCKVRNFHVY